MDPVFVEQELAALKARVKSLESRLPKTIPVVTPLAQHAPSPDYTTEAPIALEPCSCEESLDLRERLTAANARVRELEAENTECRRLLLRRVEATRLDEANAQLAAANALLLATRDELDARVGTLSRTAWCRLEAYTDELTDHISAQPAAPSLPNLADALSDVKSGARVSAPRGCCCGVSGCMGGHWAP